MVQEVLNLTWSVHFSNCQTGLNLNLDPDEHAGILTVAWDAGGLFCFNFNAFTSFAEVAIFAGFNIYIQSYFKLGINYITLNFIVEVHSKHIFWHVAATQILILA